MKRLLILFVVSVSLLIFVVNASGQSCSGGKRAGIYYTDCYPMIGMETDDTGRLQRAIDEAYGKLIFNEATYQIHDTLVLHSMMIIEGTGKNASDSTESSRIVLTEDDKNVFSIGEEILEITIRDIALTSSVPCHDPKSRHPDDVICNTVGILAQGGDVANKSSLHFLFHNIRFTGFNKGIYVNAVDKKKAVNKGQSQQPETLVGGWQFDNVKLDQCTFELNETGVHINSLNSGWDISSLDFNVPKNGIGIYLERGSYISMNLLIGNGPAAPDNADALVRVRGHTDLSIKNSCAERFDWDLITEGTPYAGRSFPIYLFNNHFFSGISVNDTTLVSSGNQYGIGSDGESGAEAWANIELIAKGYSQVTSIGDKLCNEGATFYDPPYNCADKDWELQDNAQIVFNSNQYKTASSVPMILNRDGYDDAPAFAIMPENFTGASLLRLGKKKYFFDFTRSEADGSLTISSVFKKGAGYTHDYDDPDFFGYYGYKIKTAGGTVGISGDGNMDFSSGTTITLGSSTFANLGSRPNGTLFYCSDCTAASTCAGSGSGAIAKRINSAWVCN